MKKSALFIVLIICLLFVIPLVLQTPLIKAQEQIPGLPSGLSPEEVEKTQEKIEGKWDYLSREWKNIFLRNKFVSAIDSFFTNISIVFRILFGMPYSMSFALFIVVILWFYLLINLSQILRYFSTFSPSVSLVISLALAVILAQTKVLEKIAQFFIWLIFGDKPWWFSLIIMIILILILIILYRLNKSFAKQAVANRKKMKIEEEERKLEKGVIVGEALSNAVEDVGKKG